MNHRHVEIGTRIKSNETECFECLECGLDFRVDSLPEGTSITDFLAFPCKQDLCGLCRSGSNYRKQCRNGACPRCGSLYIEWLSFDFPSEDIWLNTELMSGAKSFDDKVSVHYPGSESDQ